MTFDAFASKYNGKKVGDGQCMSLSRQYRLEVLGTPAINTMNAGDVFAAADPKYYAKIKNTPIAVPQKGDLVIWDGRLNGGIGHIAIATGKGNVWNFEVMEQNWPVGSKAHFATHNYKYVTGWLRKK